MFCFKSKSRTVSCSKIITLPSSPMSSKAIENKTGEVTSIESQSAAAMSKPDTFRCWHRRYFASWNGFTYWYSWSPQHTVSCRWTQKSGWFQDWVQYFHRGLCCRCEGLHSWGPPARRRIRNPFKSKHHALCCTCKKDMQKAQIQTSTSANWTGTIMMQVLRKMSKAWSMTWRRIQNKDIDEEYPTKDKNMSDTLSLSPTWCWPKKLRLLAEKRMLPWHERQQRRTSNHKTLYVQWPKKWHEHFPFKHFSHRHGKPGSPLSQIPLISDSADFRLLDILLCPPWSTRHGPGAPVLTSHRIIDFPWVEGTCKHIAATTSKT